MKVTSIGIGLAALAVALWPSNGAFADQGIVGTEVEEAVWLRGASDAGGPSFAYQVSSVSSIVGNGEEEGMDLSAGKAENDPSLRGVDDGMSRLSSSEAWVPEDQGAMNIGEDTQGESKQDLKQMKSEAKNEASVDETDVSWGKAGRLRNMNDSKKTEGREIRDISTVVFEELLLLHNEVHMAPFHIQGVTRRLHNIVLSASSDEDGASIPHARRLALEGLKAGADKLKTHVMVQTERHLALLERTDVLHNDRHLSTADNSEGITGFGWLIVFLSVVLVSNLGTDSGDLEPWPLLENRNDNLNGAPGRYFTKINPCKKLPLASNETFGYLPITQGFIGHILSYSKNPVGKPLGLLNDFMEKLINPDLIIETADNCTGTGNYCVLNTDCCNGDDDVIVNCNRTNQCAARYDLGHFDPFEEIEEPFCLSWSETAPDSNKIDTIGFALRDPFPPIKPLFGLVSILPNCVLDNPISAKCTHCTYHSGFPIVDFNLGPITYKLTIQMDGFAVSWGKGNKKKLAYGANSGTKEDKLQIWDGFRNQPLPEIPDINFWLRLRFNIIELSVWTTNKGKCEILGPIALLKKTNPNLKDKPEIPTPDSLSKLSILLDVELYIGVDKSTTDGEALGNSLAEDLVGNEAAPDQRHLASPGTDNPERIWRNMQDSTTREDPCIILAMTTAAIKLPWLWGKLVFADALGGYCILPPEETGTRCSPSGFFFNIRNQFKLEGNFGGLLDTLFTKAEDTSDRPRESAGNSIGIFQDPNGQTEAVVFRLEFPVTTIFGVSSVVGSVGRPIVHFQYVKGSEIERRRSTLLRKKPAVTIENEYIPNCAQIGLECERWDDFNSSDGIKTQICSDFLINESQHPDKLLYYNRVLTADPVDPKYKYVITPPAAIKYKTPAKYDFSDNLDADVFIMYLAMADLAMPGISIKEISLTLIFSDGPPPTLLEDVKEYFKAAEDAYERAAPGFSELQMSLFEPPSLYNFGSLQSYLDYLPVTDWSELNVTEIDDWSELNETELDEKFELAHAYNGVTDAAKSGRLAAFVRVFCKIHVLFFVEVSIGLIMENFADGVTPTKWAIAGQFEIKALDLLYSVSVSSQIDFDRRRHRHLEEEEYHRALASSGLEGSHWDVSFSVRCDPGSFCEAFVKFFEDLGQAIWSGMQNIATFFAEDIVGFYNDAVRVVGQWGRKFISNIVIFGQGVINDLKNTFENGKVSQLLTDGRARAISDIAAAFYSTLSDGKVSIEEALSAGADLLVGGMAYAGEFIVAGIEDLTKAAEKFFKNVGETIGDIWDGIKNSFKEDWVHWTDVRHKRTFTKINTCKFACDAASQEIRFTTSNPDMDPIKEIKTNCWCMDELECPVKIAERRRCKKYCVKKFGKETCGKKKCNVWEDMEISKDGGFPRFDTRKFDKACRTERLIGLAKAKGCHDKMKNSAKIVDTNVGTKFNGLTNFAPSTRRHRRLAGGQDPTTAVDSVSADYIQAVSAGSFVAMFDMSYQGSQLSPDSTGVNSIQRNSTRTIDFSKFENPNGESSGDDDTVLQNLKEGSADGYLGALELDDPEWLSKQPNIHPPSIDFANGSKGTQSDPFVLDCSGAVQHAWAIKLQSSDPTTMRRRRSRRLQAGFSETNIEYAVEYALRQNILSRGEVLIDVTPGNVTGQGGSEDIFKAAKDLIGVEGVGAFMDPSRGRRLSTTSLSDFELVLTVMSAESYCDRFEWQFDMYIEDSVGKRSEKITIYTVLNYGNPQFQSSTLTHIQTVCDTDGIGVEDLEDNLRLQFYYDVIGLGFSPKLSAENCPSPFLSLSYNDTVVQEGDPCTTTYKIISRAWMFANIDDSLSCDSPQEVEDLPVQTIVAGGLAVPTLTAPVTIEPATPFFELQGKTYYLPNERNATVPTFVSDFYRNETAPIDQCGICNATAIGKPGIVYTHPHDFNCGEVGDNTIGITVVNTIGISVTKYANALVIDDKPPNIFSKCHTVFLNRFGWLNETDVVTVPDVNDGTWDNCEIEQISVSPQTIYQCNDEGPQRVTLSATDPSNNSNSKDQIITVDDSARLAINGGENVIMPSVTDNLIDSKMMDDFMFENCEEKAVFVRPEGDLNFDTYNEISNGVNNKWKIPEFYNMTDSQSVSFFEAFCGGVLPEHVDEGNLCVGEVKAEVICNDFSRQTWQLDDSKPQPNKQTCYRARLIFDPSDYVEDYAPELI